MKINSSKIAVLVYVLPIPSFRNISTMPMFSVLSVCLSLSTALLVHGLH